MTPFTTTTRRRVHRKGKAPFVRGKPVKTFVLKWCNTSYARAATAVGNEIYRGVCVLCVGVVAEEVVKRDLRDTARVVCV